VRIAGQSDIQFSFGRASFAIQSPVSLVRQGEVIGGWSKGRWPDSGFFEIMNVKVSKWEIPNERTIQIQLENGIEIHLSDDSDAYECMRLQSVMFSGH